MYGWSSKPTIYRRGIPINKIHNHNMI